MSASPTTNEPVWTWTRSSNTAWEAQLQGGFIDAQQPNIPGSIVVHRRDGAASRHQVLSLTKPGSDPTVSVSRTGTPVPGLLAPTKPKFRWKHSKPRSRCHHNRVKATVFRIRRNGLTTWTYHTDKGTSPQATAGHYPTFAKRRSALRACENALLGKDVP